MLRTTTTMVEERTRRWSSSSSAASAVALVGDYNLYIRVADPIISPDHPRCPAVALVSHEKQQHLPLALLVGTPSRSSISSGEMPIRELIVDLIGDRNSVRGFSRCSSRSQDVVHGGYDSMAMGVLQHRRPEGKRGGDG
ncbi:unnamed protein product [Lactuca saligna]|uniref:Uncharacterized protein n=1 Tax=Lactuca saligna TaxID=75948 RepID=A0AA35ZE20_LACSI|nr:unnamed protein product [Lactuca saligna]